MNGSSSTISRWSSQALGVLRIVTSLLFLVHGSQKLFLLPAGQLTEAFSLFTLMGFAGFLELFGGFFLLIGLFTRPVAFILCGEMAVAYIKAHAFQGFLPLINHGELAVLYCFVFLYFVTAGSGAWSIDNLLKRRKAASGS